MLTGINLGDFRNVGTRIDDDGNTVQQPKNFYDLLQALDEVAGIERFRISSIEPNLLSPEIIEFVAQSKRIMPHFHIPLQSGSNKILGMMRRRYKRELYAERVAAIKQLMPHCCIGVDVIAGFPAETATDFKDSFDFLHQLDISYLHVFTYSERADTHALTIQPVVPVNTRHERNKMLRSLSYSKMQHFTAQHQGTIRKVLFEKGENSGMMDGYTDNYIKISAPYQAALANSITNWKI